MAEDIIITMSEEDFIKSLTHSKSKKDYILERNKKLKEIESSFKKEKDYLVTQILTKIENDKRHSSIINSCTSPFTHGPLAKTDYKFIRIAPLFELQLKNMDFLLFKKNSRCNIAIFGECKGSFSDPADVIKELKERRDYIEQKKDYIISNYLDLSESEKICFEYLIAVPDRDATRMQSYLIDKGGGYILWQASLTGPAEISCIFPPKSVESRRSMMHIDEGLNHCFDKGKRLTCSRILINYFPQSYEFNKLSILLDAATHSESSEAERIVSESDLTSVVKENLFYMEDAFIISEVADLIKKGLEIEFLEKIDKRNDKCYKITTKQRKSDSIEKYLKAKWVKYILEKELEKKKNEATIEIRKKFEKERKQKTLFDF